MDAVHIWRHDDAAKYAVQRHREPQVRVIEERGAVQQDLEGQNRRHGRSEGGHGAHLEPHRERDFGWVEAQTCRRVEVEVRVVNAMEPPERGYGVEQDMLEIDGDIEHHNSEDEGELARNGEVMQ